MIDVAENPRAVAGSNAPPVEQHAIHIEDLYDEAKNFLDGEPITTQGQAEELGKLLVSFREARQGADAQRSVEKKPHDDAAAAVQAAWKPLITKCERAEKIAKNAIGAWQLQLEAKQRAAAIEAARVAEAERQAAQEARQAAAGSERLADAEEAEAALKRAAEAEKAASRADKAKPLVATGGRSLGLRNVYRGEVTDYTVFGKWAWEHRRAEYQEFLDQLAGLEGRRGPVSIPGMTVHTERKAA